MPPSGALPHLSQRFLLISAPDNEASLIPTSTTIKQMLERKFACVFEWPVVEMPVESVDRLYAVLEDLTANDSFMKNMIQQVGSMLLQLAQDQAESLAWEVNGVDMISYLTNFSWDQIRFSPRRSLLEILTKIKTDVEKMGAVLKTKSAEYQALARRLDQVQRRRSMSLLAADISRYVQKGDILDTEYLTTVYVVVSNHTRKRFLETYETLTEYVVPQSAKLLSEDRQYGLYAVVLFRKIAGDFEAAVKANKWAMRSFDAQSVSEEDYEQLANATEDTRQSFLRWCSTHFSEVIINWAHFKYIRCFVESILRFGIPVKFRLTFIQPQSPKAEPKIVEVLDRAFGYLASLDRTTDGEGGAKRAGDREEASIFQDEAIYPYVRVDLAWDIQAK